MRKTNNTNDLNREGVNSLWVVYDAGTDETLTFYNGDEPERSEWKNVIIEEDVCGTLHEVEYSARFSSTEDAFEAARVMALYIAQMYPGDTIDLEVRHVISEMTEIVNDVRTIVTVTETWTMPDRDVSEGAERTLDLEGDDEDEQESHDIYSGAFSDEMLLPSEEEEEEPISSWTSKNFGDPVTEGEMLKKKTKVKKSARSKPKAKGTKKARA